jgi:CDP-diacylglycerol---glycerol-3-phosphate 3-phosphatidyltransferase
MNIPILLTTLRIALIPVFVAVFLWPGRWTNLAAAALFGIAALTDWLDGYLARRWGQTTRFGAFLDPVADKLIVVSAIVLLVGSHGSIWLTLPGLVIVGREIVVSALREWMAEMNRRGIVAVSTIGKYKTGMQITAILVLLAFPPGSHEILVILGYVLIYGAAIMTLISMAMYLRAAWPTLRAGLEPE